MPSLIDSNLVGDTGLPSNVFQSEASLAGTNNVGRYGTLLLNA
jgi:hypothetical protein